MMPQPARRRLTPRVPPRPSPTVAARLWPGSTVVCVGTGPSLTQADVDYCCGKARVIVVNDAYKFAPWADALYACDSRWWHWHKGAPVFHGQKYSIDPRVKKPFPAVTVLENTGERGLELGPHGLRTGKNSGYQVINLAVHLGARHVVLLGYDMRSHEGRSHVFGEHPNRVPPPYKLMIPNFATLVEPLAAVGVTVTNASRRSALECFPRAPLAEALAGAPPLEAAV